MIFLNRLRLMCIALGVRGEQEQAELPFHFVITLKKYIWLRFINWSKRKLTQ